MLDILFGILFGIIVTITVTLFGLISDRVAYASVACFCLSAALLVIYYG